MNSPWAAAADPEAPNEDVRPGENAEQPKRRGRPKGSTNTSTGARGASVKDIETTIGTGIATINALFATLASPETVQNYALRENEVGDLAKALTGEVNANATAKKWFSRAIKASPHIALATVLFSIAVPRLVVAGIIPNVFGEQQDPFNPPVPVASGGAYGGSGADRDGQVYADSTSRSAMAG